MGLITDWGKRRSSGKKHKKDHKLFVTTWNLCRRYSLGPGEIEFLAHIDLGYFSLSQIWPPRASSRCVTFRASCRSVNDVT